jgi:DNA-directed RNA polymerase subunit K
MENYTKYEIARLIGVRALQVRMGAPILLKLPKAMEKPIEIAKLEFEKNVLPITVKRTVKENARKE